MSTTQLDPEFVESVTAALARISRKDIGPIDAERPLLELGLDSISVVEMLTMLENAFDVTIADSDMAEVKTFGDLQTLISRLRAES